VHVDAVEFPMDSLIRLDGPTLEPRNHPARKLVVLCHGLGADGNDLIGLAPEWATTLPDAAFVAPNAPFPCDGAPMGRQWFALWDRSQAELERGVRMAEGILNHWLDGQLAARGLAPADCALMGFSQGAMTCLFAALRRPVPVACVLAYSGALLGAEKLAAELTAKPPVLLVHGEADPVVPVAASRAAETALRAAGVPVTARYVPGLPHGIDPGGITVGATFLSAHLGA
jgi:phospholipase/carboxylesterase